MKSINEGKHTFLFPTGWSAIKYDGEKNQPSATTYYLRHLEPINGMKAVDIVAAPPSPECRLILLEVKDFREDDADLQHKIETEHFPLEVVQKALHTISGLYLGIRAKNEELVEFGTVLLGLPARLEVVLFLAQAPVKRSPQDKKYKQALANRISQRQGIELRLRNALKPLGIASVLVDAEKLPASAGWLVQENS